MGIRRFLEKLAESDESRLADEIRRWSESVPGSTQIDGLTLRRRAKIAGVTRRLTVLPMKDDEALEAVVYDGTGEIVVRFTGRRAITGLGLGTRIVVDGMVSEQQGEVRMMNPRLEFTA